MHAKDWSTEGLVNWSSQRDSRKRINRKKYINLQLKMK